MPQVMCHYAERVINKQTNFGFPFGIDERILILVSFPVVAQKHLSLTHVFLCMFEKLTAFQQLNLFNFF